MKRKILIIFGLIICALAGSNSFKVSRALFAEEQKPEVFVSKRVVALEEQKPEVFIIRNNRTS